MSTKLGRYSEGVMEAVWIAAIIAIPLFFNIYSSRIFEPDKITILRTFALIVLAAWILKLLEQGGIKWEKIEYKGSLSKTISGIPLLIPVIGLGVVYSIATVFSVTTRISLFGSYQRLQGTFTSLSYLVIFASVVANLRKRSQVERLITVAILTSLPVGLYGILQKFEIDPVPWGGNVTNRIASNMGNSIFIAAYLIMVVPLTLGRIIEAFRKILSEDENLGTNVVRATIYVFIAAVELIAIYMSGSRGPFLGLLAGLFFMFILLSVYWRKRWLTITTIGTAALMGVFLVLLNIPNGPLEFIRQIPGVGRFGQVLDLDQRTSQVRILIWTGASELVLPHDPLVFPDGSTDKLNFLRPLIGYGPESMYVAYNQFYPPELGRVEKRNASPDRSHNETWDSLVTTGLIGFLAYLLLFGSIFFYGLKWVGLIRNTTQRNLFIICLTIGGVIGGVGLAIWQGVGFLGVGIPFGILMGLIAYITVVALFSSKLYSQDEFKQPHVLVLILLLGAIVAHFAEINFGIAIVATRTHFWLYTGLFFVVGFVFPLHGKIELTDQASIIDVNNYEEEKNPKNKKRSKRNRFRRAQDAIPIVGKQPTWRRNAFIGALIISILLITLGYDFISNPNSSTSLSQVIISSYTRLPNKDNAVSYGVLALVITTWLFSAMILSSEQHDAVEYTSWTKIFLTTLGYSSVIVIAFWILHANKLAVLSGFRATNQFEVLDQIDRIGGLLSQYYIFLFGLLFILALFLPEDWASKVGVRSLAPILAPIAMILVILVAYWTNVRVIHSDIAFKMAEPFANSNQWAVATFIYKRALELAPNEDHYYLFLGKSYLEQAKDVSSVEEQDALVQQAENDLKVAQKINSLNTDHTANLGRLYSWWAGRTNNPEIRSERARIASEYYRTAVKLSPNNPNLWNEWAILYMDVLGDPSGGFDRLSHSLELDNQYSWTHSILGDYYLRLARTSQDTTEKLEFFNKSIKHYNDSVQVSTNRETEAKVGYLVSLGNVYIELANNYPEEKTENIRLAIEAYLLAIDAGPRINDRWKIEETLSRLFAQLGDKENSLSHAYTALSAAPDDQKENLQTLISQIQLLP
jgi:tetratricopeptide (TPR) repeat protein/O-antigen ligase